MSSRTSSFPNNSFPNTKFPQTSFDNSVSIEDLMRQNQDLKQNIEQLIDQNTQLTEIIEELSYQHQLANQNVPNLNQEQLEALAHQVIELQQELDLEKQNKQQTIVQNEDDAEKTIKIIEELSTEFQTMQEHYHIQIQKLQKQLAAQKGQCKMILKTTETKFNKTLEEYQSLLGQLKQKNELIANLESKLSQTSHSSKKQLKKSTTIEDLRQTLERQIEQKEGTIRVYQELIRNLRVKLMEK